MPSETDASKEGFVERVAAAPRTEQIGLLLSYLGEVILEILERPPATPIRADQRIFELGIGSLIVVDLKSRLEERFEVELPVALFFKHSTVGEIADCLLQRLPLSAGGAQGVEVGGANPRARGESSSVATRVNGREEELSQEQAEAELLAKLDHLDKRTTP